MQFHCERRKDLTPLKLAVFDAMAEGHSIAHHTPASQQQQQRRRPPLSKLWAVYRKALRLFLVGELTKPELDAVVIYALGEDRGTLERSVRLILCDV